MKTRTHLDFWIDNFINDRNYGHMRFKRLEKGYPPFVIDDELIDTVEFEEFIKIENDRIPIFIGSQFGINPRIKEIPNFFNGIKLIAILSKSLLSGCVNGLTLYEINENDTTFDLKNKVGKYLNY
jgi:hypothetical protein